jgi:hypothetical protein
LTSGGRGLLSLISFMPSRAFFDGENTLLTGSAKQLDDLVEDDVFRASVTVLGKMDYDTQIGGNTTVPLLEVNNLKVIG